MNLVSFVENLKTKNCSRQTIRESLNLIQYKFNKSITNIVIKPNMCYYWDYSTGRTTDPNFVAKVIQLLREEISPDVNISVIESDASAMKCKYAFPILGYNEMAKKNNVELVNLSKDEGKEIEVSVREKYFKFILPQTIENADLKINIPKIKYMSETKISCALKNIFGCNPYPNKYKCHPKLDETIVALNKIMKFDLHILDGLIVTGSLTRKLDLVMASQDPVAFDSAAAKIVGINPKTVKHIVLANREGLGDTTYIHKGANMEPFVKRFPKRKMKDDFLSFSYKIARKIGLI